MTTTALGLVGEYVAQHHTEARHPVIQDFLERRKRAPLSAQVHQLACQLAAETAKNSVMDDLHKVLALQLRTSGRRGGASPTGTSASVR